MNEYIQNNSYSPSSEWELIFGRAERVETTYYGEEWDAEGLTYVDIYYNLHFKRNRNWGLTNFIIPTVFICFLVILVFLLPPESGEKIGFSITSFLTLMVVNQLIADQTPPSIRQPLISDFLMHAMIMNTISLMGSILVLRLHHYEPAVQWSMNRFQKLIFLHSGESKTVIFSAI